VVGGGGAGEFKVILGNLGIPRHRVTNRGHGKSLERLPTRKHIDTISTEEQRRVDFWSRDD
jgi:hypothetical protein